jgi:hypothetical protein
VTTGFHDWDFRPPQSAAIGDHDVPLVSSHLEGRRVALVVTGGIAALRTPDLARALRRRGAEVTAICSAEALPFVGRQALEWATCRPLVTRLSWRAEHLSDAEPFDVWLVAPATANTIAKLASGIADAMAKWYEASVSSGTSGDGLVQQAVQMARVLRDQLLLEGEAALAEPGGEAWVRVAEACGLTAGLIGGLGGARCRTVAAHAVHNGLTQLAASHGRLHGEKVGFGILVQLRLEEQVGGNRLASQARRQLISLFRRLALPITLADLGLGDASLAELERACHFACRDDSDLHQLPFRVDATDLLTALVSTTAELRVS